MTDEEVWVEIADFPDYIISSEGAIRHKDRPHTDRKTATNHQGFPTLVLFRAPSKNRYVRQVNKLVAQAFLEPPEHRDMKTVWHIDGDLQNCAASNLRWDRFDRVLEWNEMHRTGTPRYRTPSVMDNTTGKVFSNAYECGLYVGELETSIISYVEGYVGVYEDRGKFRYVR